MSRETYGRIGGRPGRRRREALLHRDPVCATPGCFAPSEQMDHVVPLFEGGAESEDNMQGLCAPCHAAKTAGERRRWLRRPRKSRVPPEWRLFLVHLIARSEAQTT